MAFLEKRRRGGLLRVELDRARAACREKNSFENGVKYICMLVSYLAGCRTEAFLHDRCFLYFYSIYRYRHTRSEMDLLIKKVCRTRFYHGHKICLERYHFPPILQYTHCEKAVLYHKTSAENCVSIMAEGLKPGKTLLVYMADATDYYTGGHSALFGGENAVVFKIDAARLKALGHTIYRNDCGEYLTDCVERECITVMRMQPRQDAEAASYCMAYGTEKGIASA